MYSARAVANWFIKKSKETNTPLDQIKLMKLVYIAQGLALANDTRLFNEPIEAWKYGPVISVLYNEFKKYGLNSIEEYTYDDFLDDQIPMVADDDNQANTILEQTWGTFSKYSGIKLSNWSHNENGPWHHEWHENNGQKSQNHSMDEQRIANYFKEFYKDEG